MSLENEEGQHSKVLAWEPVMRRPPSARPSPKCVGTGYETASQRPGQQSVTGFAVVPRHRRSPKCVGAGYETASQRPGQQSVTGFAVVPRHRRFPYS